MTVPPGYPPGPPVPPPYPQQNLPVCVRHPDRPTGLRCVRCDRPACPQCLREASVGYQCVDCVEEGRRTVRRPTTIAGAKLNTKLAVVPTLVVLNVLVFAATAAQAGNIAANDQSGLFDSWVLWPIGVVGFGEPWRLLTAGFLHFGPFHLALNMLALWIIGRDIEPMLGRARFLAVYLLALLGGSASVFVFDLPQRGTAGASGAVWGMMGALLILILRLKLNPQPVIVVIAINVFISFLPGISLLGHLGGFVAGVAATAALVYAPRGRQLPVQVGALVTIGVVLLALIALRWAQLSAAL
jgi:membrane associated rhomboid family serine protease